MTAASPTIDAHVPVGTWTVDPAHSSVGFSVRHLMGKVRGTFEEFTGHLRTAEQPTDCSVTATIAMSSVNTGNRMRDNDHDNAVARHRDCFPVMDGHGSAPRRHPRPSRRPHR